MDQRTPTDGTAPSAQVEGQLSFSDLEPRLEWRLSDGTFLPWLLHRLAEGDVVRVTRDGDWIFADPA